MLKMRLQRTGKKHDPSFRLILTDSRSAPKSGRYIELLGSYNARKEGSVQLKKERINYWISKGVQLSNTVHNLLAGAKIIDAPPKTSKKKKNVS